MSGTKAPQVVARPITTSELAELSRPATPPVSAFSLPARSAPAVVAAPAADPNLRILRTQSGERRVHVGKKIAIEGTDGVGRLGILVNVQGGFVDVQFDDKVRRIAEADVKDASEL